MRKESWRNHFLHAYSEATKVLTNYTLKVVNDSFDYSWGNSFSFLFDSIKFSSSGSKTYHSKFRVIERRQGPVRAELHP